MTLSARLRAADLSRLSAVVGFDGFIDEMISVVDERRSLTEFSAVPTIADMAAIFAKAAGRSSLREIVVHRIDAGGCAVNLGDGLAGLGVQLDYFGTLGTPRHPAFDAFVGRCRSVRSWCREPGRTLALEFRDGKYMLSSVAQLAELTPDYLEGALADGAFSAACADAGLLAFTNWTLYPHMTACWQFLQQRVLPGLKHRPAIFLDLVDPSSRSPADIQAMLATLPGFAVGGPVTLGLNGNEGNVLARLLGVATAADAGEPLAAQAAALRERLGIDAVVIHGVRSAAVAESGGTATCDTPWCAAPKKLTGAGDRFNSGYGVGLLLGLEAKDRLRLGNAASGFFVRQARSGNAAELADLLDRWADGSLDR
ncbi:hypothetical protein LBMAG53_03560 [Planctomycetota bacterium]|nr:hypothetical protein LBMAG53_03560 [Planctomycetota bacterium]